MPALYTCDVCGKNADWEDYDGDVLCEYHSLNKEVEFLKREYEQQKQWLISTHLHHLQEIKKKIKEKESEMKKLI
jgi:uncharacterized Zn finger protein (UPF0148 family)